MYNGYLGMNRRPFVTVPNVEYYFPASAIENAHATLARCVQRGEGPALVIGPSGTGKTLLCMLLGEQFRRLFQVVTLAGGGIGTRRALFQAVLYGLGRPYRGMDEGELRLAVVDHLMSGGSNSQGMLLLVDEAHTLPLRLLDEIRLLSNLARNGQPLVRLVLAGSPVLEERFASPKLDSFNQRLSARCYLENFNRTETLEYVQTQIRSAGASDTEVFDEAACQSVYEATGGVPRLINQLCDHALLLAYVAGRRWVGTVEVEEAWADLQQLPTRAGAESAERPTTSSVIEFGSLDDSDEAVSPTSDAAAQRATVFRVASVEDDETETADTKAGRQIHRIERLLAEAAVNEEPGDDDDFRPAGTIGPELELRFEETSHPFQEEFEHEEVVADRYAPARRETPTAVASEPTTATPALEKPLGRSEGEDAVSDTCVLWSPTQPASPSTTETPASSTGTAAFAAKTGSIDRGAHAIESHFDLGQTSTSDGAGREAWGGGEAPDERGPEPTKPGHHREYRRLFARLRQG